MSKLSTEFSARLAKARSKEKVRAVVMLVGPDTPAQPAGARPTREARQATIAAVRSSAEKALEDIDRLLERYGGRRLSEEPTALGTVAIESTPAGISALARSEHVKAILEDQAISRVS
jgi:hypothetical protein